MKIQMEIGDYIIPNNSDSELLCIVSVSADGVVAVDDEERTRKLGWTEFQPSPMTLAKAQWVVGDISNHLKLVDEWRSFAEQCKRLERYHIAWILENCALQLEQTLTQQKEKAQ